MKRKGQSVEAIIEERRVDNPSYTDGLYYGDSEQVRDRNMHVVVTENAMTRLGAFCHVKARNRLPHHERTAERFKSEYEALFGSGVPALDNSRPVVDRSPVAHDSGMAAKVDRGRDIIAVLAYLGKSDADLMIDWLVLCTPASEYADMMPSGVRNQRQISEYVAMRLAVLDRLAVHWNYGSR